MRNKWIIVMLLILFILGTWGLKIIFLEISNASKFPKDNSISNQLEYSPENSNPTLNDSMKK